MTTEIILTTPVEIDGVSIVKLTMREPTVGDQLTAERRKGAPGETEVAMFAALCSQADSLITQITMRDYKKLQKAYSDFLS